MASSWRGTMVGLVALVGCWSCERGGSPSSVTPVKGDQAATATATDDGAAGPESTPDPDPDPGPPVTLTAVPQYGIGPAAAWHFDPAGDWVAWKNEDECGLWRFDTGLFAGYFADAPDGPCARWPTGRTSFATTRETAPASSARAGASASVYQTGLQVKAEDGSSLLDVDCEGCRRYRAVAWSPDGSMVAVARTGPWGVDVWDLDAKAIVDRIDLDAEGKEQDIGLVWGEAGMFAFVTHSYDPNEAARRNPDAGMEDYEHVHGPATSVFPLALPRPPQRQGDSASVPHTVHSVSTSVSRIVIDPAARAAWVQLRNEDPRAFGNSYWTQIPLGADSRLHRETMKERAAIGDTLGGRHVRSRWVERPYEILEVLGQFERRTKGEASTPVVEALGFGAAGHAEGSAWLAQTPIGEAGEIRRAPTLDGLGLGWHALRSSLCPAQDSPDDACAPEGLAPTCELIDFTPDGRRTLSYCAPKLALLERDGAVVVELLELPPSEVRWRWVDEQTLALLGDDRELKLVSVVDGQIRERIPDVRQIYPLVAGAKYDLFAYRTGAGFHLRSVDGKRSLERPAGIFAAAISPDGDHVALTDRKRVEIYAIATGERVAGWRASKIRKLAYRQDGAILFGTQVRERGPTRAWDPSSGAERNEALPTAERARSLAENPSWRWYWTGARLFRALDDRSLRFDYQAAMLDNGLYEGEVPRSLSHVVLRRGDAIGDFTLIHADDIAPLLRREGLVDAFIDAEALPEVIVGAHDLERTLAAVAARDQTRAKAGLEAILDEEPAP